MKARGTGISKRSPEYIADKMKQGKAVIAPDPPRAGGLAFHTEEWSGGEFVFNSGLIVDPLWRGKGVAAQLLKKKYSSYRDRSTPTQRYSALPPVWPL